MFTCIGIFAALGIGLTSWLAAKPKKFWLLMILIAALAILLVLVPTVASFAHTTQGAERVANYYDADIFYNAQTDEYFIIEESFWNPVHQHIRHEINYEKAVELVEAYEAAQSQPFVKILSN